MDDHPGEEFRDWEILPDHELSRSRAREISEDDGIPELDDNASRHTIEPHYISSDPADDLGIEEDFGDETPVVPPASDDLKWVDPCLDSSFIGMAVEMDGSEKKEPENSFDSGDLLLDNGVSQTEKVNGEMGICCNEEIKETGKELNSEGKEGNEGEIKPRGWWNSPFEFVKALVMRINPFWSLPIGVVAMGFLVLGRRWYKARRKTGNSHLMGVCLEDKQKVSLFMAQAARLNESFSVVRRIPITRSSLLSTGVFPWPTIGLR